MTASPPPERSSLDESLRRAHRSVLVTLAVCAVFCVVQDWVPEEPPPARETTVVAVGLAVVAIVLRRLSGSPVMAVRTRVGMLAGSYVACVALGLLGAYVASEQAAVQTGLVFCAAAAIFCLRPPPPVAPPSRRARSGDGA